MKPTFIILLILFAACKPEYKQDLSRQKVYGDSSGRIWVADSNCIMKMYVYDTIYLHDTIYTNNSGTQNNNTGNGEQTINNNQ